MLTGYLPLRDIDPGLFMPQIPVTTRPVHLNHIDFQDTGYNLRPDPEDKAPNSLIRSIRQYTLLHPPLLKQINDQRYVIVSGRRRLLAARQLECTQPVCLVACVDQKTEPLFLPRLHLEHARIGSGLSIIEQAVFIRNNLEILEEEQVTSMLDLLGYRPQPHRIRWLLDFLELDQCCIHSLHNGSLVPAAGAALARFSSSDQCKIVSLIERFHFGGSKQRQLITLVDELLMRTPGTSLTDIISAWEQQQHDHRQLNIPQTGASLLQWLRKKCSPRSMAAEKDFNRFVRTLKLPEGISIDHTKEFEDNGLTLSIPFDSARTLQENWPKIREILGK